MMATKLRGNVVWLKIALSLKWFHLCVNSIEQWARLGESAKTASQVNHIRNSLTMIEDIESESLLLFGTTHSLIEYTLYYSLEEVVVVVVVVLYSVTFNQ